jgi:S1-C subfamily serine protease
VKSLKKITLLMLATVILSVVINSHYRSIQETLHEGISWVWKQNETVGEALYDTNAFLFNGDAFDHERKIKDYIYSSFPSVVMINVFPNEQSQNNPLVQRKSGRGTGFFVSVDDESATIMTNYHVIEGYIGSENLLDLKINTAIDMWVYEATIIGYDIVADIALIKILKKDNEKWEALEFADPEEISEGDPVVVIGHGMSLPWNSTQGIVTYDGRFGQRPYSLMLQVDAVINQGNSGGPVIGTDRKVYGVAQSILSPGRAIPGWDGVGLAVGSRQAKRSMDYILSDAYAEKGYVPYSDLLFNTKNFEIESVIDTKRKDRHMSYFNILEPDLDVKAPTMEVEPVKLNAGQIAGMQEGDIILELNGKSVYTAFKIFIETMYAIPGDTATIKVLRGEEELEFTLVYQETDFQKLKKSIEDRNKLQRSGK